MLFKYLCLFSEFSRTHHAVSSWTPTLPFSFVSSPKSMLANTAKACSVLQSPLILKPWFPPSETCFPYSWPCSDGKRAMSSVSWFCWGIAGQSHNIRLWGEAINNIAWKRLMKLRHHKISCPQHLKVTWMKSKLRMALSLILLQGVHASPYANSTWLILRNKNSSSIVSTMRTQTNFCHDHSYSSQPTCF